MAASPEPLRVALAQIDATVGDLHGNRDKIAAWTMRAREAGAALVVFPELALTGYPPEDLLLRRHFLGEARAALEELAAETRGIVALVGFPELDDDVYNAAAVLADGAVAAVYRKVHLPNYGVFDEARYFRPGRGGAVLALNGVRIGITVCEDIWLPGPPATDEALAGAELIVNLSASPFHAGKGLERERMLIQRARDNLTAVVFCNAVGGQDELVFDGYSLAVDERGTPLARAPQFEESLCVCSIDPGAVAAARLRDPRRRPLARGEPDAAPLVAALEVPAAAVDGRVESPPAEPLSPEAEVYAALSRGLRDYVDKNGFGRVVLALSGGIDSALVALVAVDALGCERVTCVSMPSPYSSEATKADARS
ncbi:MAG: nitrilase-related carbon-nitrogen hydrolase, partial [Nocardioidaceae bacterium]